MADQHLIMAEHTTAHWPEELYLPSAIVDRDNREQWTKLGAKDTYQRAIDDVERRLASYRAPETDPLVDAELRRIIISGLDDQTELPLHPRGRGAVRGRARGDGRTCPAAQPATGRLSP